ncbi:PAS domain S-box protein [Pantanalinema sp. GBBB05]|uniref:PAS domain S-box protein n=1 Tax=Pantanalinema sp. GBBB05 TaxID=2604139 RepID=UPI001D6E2847|nr:PAS domain S-box protein [Pantanalinema sp. GBBB05]
MSRWIVRFAIGFTSSIGILVLLGWQWEHALLKQGLLTATSTIKANTAVCFVLAGITLGLLQLSPMLKLPRSAWRWLQRLSHSLAWILLFVGALTLGEYLFGWNVGIDQLLWSTGSDLAQPYPDRMGQVTAINFTLLGIIFLCLRQKPSQRDWIAQMLAILALLISLSSLLGYLFHAEIFYRGLIQTTAIAPTTAVTFIVILLGVLSLYPDRALMQVVTSSLVGGSIARQLLPWAIGFPLLFNWLAFQGEQLHWYNTEFANVSRTVVTMALLTSVVWWIARSLNQREQRRQRTEAGLLELDQQFQRAIVNAPIPIMLHAENGEILQLSHAWTEITGYTLAEIPTIAAWTERAYGEQQAIIQAKINQLYSLTERIAEPRIELRTCQGEARIWDFFSAPIGRLANGRRVIMSAAIDVTDRHQAELAVQQLNTDLEQRVAERTLALMAANDRLRQELAERQQLERELAEGEQRLDDFFNAASTAKIGLCIHDRNLRYLKVNQALADSNGYALEAHLGRTVTEVLPELSSTIAPLLQQVLTTGQPIADQEVVGTTAAHPNQTLNWRVSYFPIFNHANQVIAVGVMVIDITDRKRVEQLIQASEARYRAIVEDQTELICRYLPDGTILFTNGAYCRYFGLNPDTIIGKSYAPIIFEADQETVTQLVRSMNAENPTVRIENRVVVGTEVRWTQWINRMLFDDQGQFIEYQSVGRDITELKQVEAALQEKQALLSGIISGSQDIIAAVDQELHLIAFNQVYHDEFLKIFGYDVQLGTNLLEALRHLPQEQSRVIELWQQALAGQEFTLTEEFGDTARQRNYYEISYSAIRDAQGQQIGATVIARDVSDRQRTEQLLRESEERYRSVVAAMAEGVVLQQATGEITAWNHSAEQILGLTAEQLLGQTSIDLDQRTIREDGSPFPGDLHPSMVTLRTGQPQADVIMGIHKAEGITWISINSQPLCHSDQPQPYAVVASFTDITAHKQAEERLRESEVRFRSAFDDAAIGMALVALDGKFLQVNRALCDIVGYSAPELVTLNFQSITFPADLDRDLRLASKLLKGEISTYQMEKRYLHKQGHSVWVSLNGSLVRDASGKPLYFIAQVQDISDRKQAEQALELQAVITRNIAEGICLIRAEDGIIVYANPKFEQMFGYAPNELTGKSTSIVHYADATSQAETTTQTLIHQVTQSGEVTYEVHTIKKDGTPFWCRATTSIFAHPDYGDVLVAVQQDITERKQVEEKIRASLKEKEVLLKEIHHRVKNNLQIVDGLLKMQSRRTQDPQVSAVLRDSQSRIASIALVHEKLYRSADLANIDFAQYVRELTSHLLESYNVDARSIHLHTQVAGVFFDIEIAIPCGLIINELVSNALKYAFPESQLGDIWIELQSNQDQTWTLRVRDNGVGVPPGFDINNTRSLGMTLVQGLVEQLEGSLSIESTQGSDFSIVFPGSKL